ncbi:hypothetical protein GCM10010921_07120 [Microbacterium album]|uniref:Uncharacterized protein n=1 Tax=Microbacterium album TaxID=2053191 RepID=A0A917ID95_9MICO|nr:hypothetical protein GCM10010921_07120 [Microbacterium album]
MRTLTDTTRRPLIRVSIFSFSHASGPEGPLREGGASAALQRAGAARLVGGRTRARTLALRARTGLRWVGGVEVGG